MAEKLEDLNLPNASVQKIIKEALPETINIGKDARSALSRAASVFILYVTSQASNEAQKANRKTLIGQDIIRALEELEFENFIEPLKDILKDFKESKTKKDKVSKPKKSNDEENDGIEEGEEDNDETEDPMEDV